MTLYLAATYAPTLEHVVTSAEQAQAAWIAYRGQYHLTASSMTPKCGNVDDGTEPQARDS